MSESAGAVPRAARRERWIVATLLTLVVIFRSAVFVFWEQSQFDADQAIVGLMAKHIAELRAFPLFYYGQTYMLGVEAWLAAPVFLLAGVSVTALKLPLLVMNVIITLLLLRIFERDVGLRPWLAAVPALFFALPAPGTASHLLAPNGGNLGPVLYVLLIWLTRHHPNWCGAIFALGFLQREFTLYGLAALLAIELFQRTLFTRDGILRRLRMLRAAAEVWLLVQWLKYFSSAAGPGTTMADLHVQRDNIALLANRICLDLSALPSGAWKLATEHWPILFGTRVQPLVHFDIESPLSQGLPGSSLLLAAALILAAAAVLVHLLRERRWRREYDFCAYLVLVGLFSAAGYVLGRCGQLTVVVIRYELLSVLGAAGLGAWFMATSPSRVALRTWTGLACALIAVGALAHGRLLVDYVRDAPAGTKRMIARHLETSGIRHATSDYWLAYALTFLTNERVIVASEDLVRIQEYQRIVNEHRDEAVRVSRRTCVGGRMVVRGVYFCPPS